MLSLFHFASTNLYAFLFTVERKDQKTLEKLRAERKAKIDELKERTNYYLTQQLIQVSGQVSITQQQQQQHSLFSQSSWGRLEMKPERNKFKVQAH